MDAIVADYYEIDLEDLSWILRECYHPRERIGSLNLDPKGFWRVDKDKDPELRHTVLTLVAFRDLKTMIRDHRGDREKGIEAFCNQNNGEGWMLPETLCLADLDLGHDERAKKPQLVRERLGPRFLPWQLEQSLKESWAECELHARNIVGEDGFKRLKAELDGKGANSPSTASKPGANEHHKRGSNMQGRLFPEDGGLFGDINEEPVRSKRKRRS